MVRRVWWAVVLLLGSRCFLEAQTAAPARPDALTAAEWAYDVIHLKNGNVLKGLILQEQPQALTFQHISRKPGRPTLVFSSTVQRSEIQRIDKLSPSERDKLKDRLVQLEAFAQQLEQIVLQRVAWEKTPNAAWYYESDYFTLTSDAPEETVRLAASRLEQIYAAYVRFLPPRHKGGKPTTIVLFRSKDDYYRRLDADGRKFRNPAFYDPSTNRIWCGSDLQRMGEDLERVRLEHQRLRDELHKQELEFRRLYSNPKDLARHLAPLHAYRRQIAEVDRKNLATFDRATQQLFSLLYHEAFHAYLANFVYRPLPPQTRPNEAFPGELPVWLNEGLAQIFQSALVEGNELRVGHVETPRWTTLRQTVKSGQMLPVRQLLKLDPKWFRVEHHADSFDSEKMSAHRAYQTSWAVAFYLMFERRLLGTPALDRFVCSVQTGEDAVVAFEQLVGASIDQFEKDLAKYLLRLQPDGSVSETLSGN